MPRSRLKVLFLVESLSGGGAEKVLSGLVRGLDRERFDVTVCTVVDCGPYREEVGKYAHYRTIGAGSAGSSTRWCTVFCLWAGFTSGALPGITMWRRLLRKVFLRAFLQPLRKGRPGGWRGSMWTWRPGPGRRGRCSGRWRRKGRLTPVFKPWRMCRKPSGKRLNGALERMPGPSSCTIRWTGMPCVPEPPLRRKCRKKSVSALSPWGVWKNRRALTG